MKIKFDKKKISGKIGGCFCPVDLGLGEYCSTNCRYRSCYKCWELTLNAAEVGKDECGFDKESFLKIAESDFCPQDLGFVLTRKCDFDCYECWETALKEAEVKDE